MREDVGGRERSDGYSGPRKTVIREGGTRGAVEGCAAGCVGVGGEGEEEAEGRHSLSHRARAMSGARSLVFCLRYDATASLVTAVTGGGVVRGGKGSRREGGQGALEAAAVREGESTVLCDREDEQEDTGRGWEN